MKQFYILLILICILIINNYISKKKTKKKDKKKDKIKKIKRGGQLLENFNDKTTYFKIKINKNDEKHIITTEGSEIVLKEDDDKIVDIPNKNIWEMKLFGTNYMIQNL